MKVAIAGASGFVGRGLTCALSGDPRITKLFGLTRGPSATTADPKFEWRTADLADYSSTAKALRGADLAIYLVHSMSPQARLSQGTFDDFDLHQADNFARACRAEGVGKIFYLGGLLPGAESERRPLSDHLRSRMEVERVLASAGAVLTSVRAGLIVGPGGSSTEILLRLVRRLPVMLAPRWTRTISEPVAEGDVAKAFARIVLEPRFHGESWDLTAAEPLTYLDLMREVARTLGLSRRIIPVPVFTPGLSRLWVSLVTGAPRPLVYPLVKSLAYAMRSRPDRDLLRALSIRPESLRSALATAARERSPNVDPFPRRAAPSGRSTVRSIQRITGLPDRPPSSLGSIAEAYFEWLPRFLLGVIAIRKRTIDGRRTIHFRLRFTDFDLLVLKLEAEEDPTIERFHIIGGWLRRPGSGGNLEFRRIPAEGCALSIVQDFVPKLPWFVYTVTQAPIHLFVMNRFAADLRRRWSRSP